jgi:hypothetical protein
MGKLHMQMLGVLGIQDASDIIKLPEDIKPMDPVAENMAMLQQTPIKAFLYQDHDAHIAAHMAAMQDPMIAQLVGQSPFASAIQGAAMSHITEHLAYKYRKEIEMQLGVPLPPEGEQLPEDVEIQLSRAVAQAAAKLLNKNMAEQQAQGQQQDPNAIFLQAAAEEAVAKAAQARASTIKTVADAGLSRAKTAETLAKTSVEEQNMVLTEIEAAQQAVMGQEVQPVVR